MAEFDEIYRVYFDDVYKYVLTLCSSHSVAEEITQETFFKALKNIGTFNGSCKIYVWLCQIAKNTYFSHYKRETKHTTQNVADHVDPVGLERNLVDKDEAFRVHKVLHSLEEPYKEVFTLRTFGELPFAKIGDLFGKTDGWARIIYHRAKLRIKEGL